MGHMAPTNQAPYTRKRRLIAPGFQLKIIGVFALLGGISMLFQAVILSRALTVLGERSASLSTAVLGEARGLILESLLFGLACSIPLFAVVGLVVTFRIAGPLYRIHRYLKAVAERGYEGPCQIRKDDELQDLCGDLNRAMDRLREARANDGAAKSAREPAAALPAGAKRSAHT